MSYKFINGHANPGFQVRSSSNAVLYSCSLSMKTQGCREYHQDHYYERRLINGKIKRTYRWTDYRFVIDASQCLLPDDAEKLKIVLNWEKQGYIIRMFPSSDLQQRYFTVCSESDEERELYISPQTADAYGNQGFIVSFKTTEPRSDINWINLNNLPVIAAGSCSEF